MQRLTALLLRMLHGRVGSTLLMQLLASSEEVACERVMPYERRYLAHFQEIASARHIPWPSTANSCVDLDDLAKRSLGSLWEAFSAAVAGQARRRIPRYYAEKSLVDLQRIAEAGIPFQILDVVRDPRDIYVSARAMARRLGQSAFGIHPGEPEPLNMALFLNDIAVRLQSIGSAIGDVEPVLVRYEDMIDDLPGLATRLGRNYGVTFEPAAVVPPGAHATSVCPSASVGRWRQELDPEQAALMTKALAEPLRRFGYPLE
jgi:hypothetical protein